MEVLYVSDTMCPRHLYSYFLIIVIERNGSIHFIQKIIIWYNMAILCTCTCICRYTASLYLVQVFLVGAAMWHIYCIHSFLWIDYFFCWQRIVIWTFKGFEDRSEKFYGPPWLFICITLHWNCFWNMVVLCSFYKIKDNFKYLLYMLCVYFMTYVGLDQRLR